MWTAWVSRLSNFKVLFNCDLFCIFSPFLKCVRTARSDRFWRSNKCENVERNEALLKSRGIYPASAFTPEEPSVPVEVLPACVQTHPVAWGFLTSFSCHFPPAAALAQLPGVAGLLAQGRCSGTGGVSSTTRGGRPCTGPIFRSQQGTDPSWCHPPVKPAWGCPRSGGAAPGAHNEPPWRCGLGVCRSLGCAR